MSLRTAANNRLANLIHLDRRLNPGFDAQLLKRILHCQGIHDRGQHAHIIGLCPVHSLGCTGHASENVPAADDQADFKALVLRRFHLGGQVGDRIRIDAELAGAHQGFP